MLSLVLLAGCQNADRPANDPRAWTNILADAAIADSRLPPPPLTPIAQPQAKLVTWKKKYGPNDFTPGPTSFSRPLWTTIEGELQSFCQKFVAETHPDTDRLRQRVERVLGLRDGDGRGRVIVVLEAEAQDVVRPCPDPAITTTACPARYDDTTLRSLIAEHPNAAHLLLSQILNSYVENGYPFTRRGYTYDWDRSARPDHFGLSEYVTLPNARIHVLAAYEKLEDYCAPPH